MPPLYQQTLAVKYDTTSNLVAYNGVPKPEQNIVCSETNNSPSSLVLNRDSGSTSTRELRINGTYNRETALNLVSEWLTVNDLYSDRGIPLKSRTLQIDPNGAPSFTCTLEYSDATDEKWIDEVQIATTGGSAHIETSYDTRIYGPCIQGDYLEATFGKIGIDTEGKPEGVDVKRPNLQINVTVNWSYNSFGVYEMNQLLNNTATINYTNFWGFPAGSLLFEGANIDRVSFTDTFDNSYCYRWRIQYVFSGMPGSMATDYVVNPISGQVAGFIEYGKEGWDYVWKKYKNAMINGEMKQVLKQVNVEKVYPYYEFRRFGLPTNLFTLGESIDSNGVADW